MGLPGPWIFLHSQLSLFYGPFLVGPIFVTSSETAHLGVVMIELFCLLPTPLDKQQKTHPHLSMCKHLMGMAHGPGGPGLLLKNSLHRVTAYKDKLNAYPHKPNLKPILSGPRKGVTCKACLDDVYGLNRKLVRRNFGP